MQMQFCAPARPARTAKSRLAGLDTLRALAIVAVMLYHLNWRLPPAFASAHLFGWMGVDLFFVLSGYLIGSQLLKPLRDGHRTGLIEFYRRRAYRILPAYLAVLTLYVVWPGWHEDTGMSPLWQFLTFTENLFCDYTRNFAFSHVWSLCVEEHFYLLLPLIVLLLARRPAAWKVCATLGIFVLLGIAARTYILLDILRPLGPHHDGFDALYIERIYYPTYSRLDGLLAGVALALIRVFRPRWWTALVQRGHLLLATGVTLIGFCVWLFRDRFASVHGSAAASTIIGFPLLSLGLAFCIPAAADARCGFARLRIPGAQTLAMLAYSLYLTHKEIGSLVHRWLPTLTDPERWITVPIYAVSCLAAAALLYFAIERPFLLLREQRDGMHQPAPDLEAFTEPAL